MLQSLRRSTRPFQVSIASPRIPFICQRCLTRIAARRQQASSHIEKAAQLRSLHDVSRAGTAAFFKEIKDVKQQDRVEKAAKGGKKKSKSKDPRLERWELVVGIEVHAELNTARKLFSAAQTSSNAAPNTHVALFDVAFPGTQPQFQKETVIPALRAALALNCDIQRRSSFDRKHYYYQDQPAGYQITQYYEPFAKDGHITLFSHDGIAPEDGNSVTIGIKQIQMEQDTAKTIHQAPSTHLLDFNRVSHPLIEIITLPQIHQPATAAACVRKIQSILRSVDAATAGMELGGLRADVNVSVCRRDQSAREGLNNSYSGVTGLGQRTEIKNLSSVKAIEDAIIAERDRQIEVLESGGVIEGETRGWTIGETVTTKLRGKEGEVDYRYMPDPDISPVFIGQDLIDHLRKTLPKVPDETLDMMVKNSKYGLTMKDAKTILVLDDGERLDYYMELVEILRSDFVDQNDILSKIGKTAGNWVLHELGGLLVSSGTEWVDNPVPPSKIALILSHLLKREITGKVAKNLLSAVFDDPSADVVQIIEEENLLLRPMLRDEYIALADTIIEANDETAQVVRDTGHQGKLMFLVGQMIRNGEEGRIEADKAKAILQEKFGIST